MNTTRQRNILTAIFFMLSTVATAEIYEKKINGVKYGFNIKPSGSFLGVINETNKTITIKATEIVIATDNGDFSPCLFLLPIMQTISGTSGTPVESVTIAAGLKGLFPLVGCGDPNMQFSINGSPKSIKVGSQAIVKIEVPSKQNDSNSSTSGWNQDENLADAARQYKGVYCSTGMNGLEDYVRGCYASLDLKQGTVPQKLERCVGIDYAASRVDAAIAQAAKFETVPFFRNTNMLTRTRGAFKHTGIATKDLDAVIDAVGKKTISNLDSIGWTCKEG